MTDYDIIIIGTGAGGGTLAYALANTGKRILLLDRGKRIPNEADNWNPGKIYLEGKYQTDETWLDSQSQTIEPALYQRVGGNTKVYGGALFRMRPDDFGEVQHYGGISPAWCVDYDTFEPYYTQAEQLYRVHGQRGIDPTEPPTKAAYPGPPIPHANRIAQVEQQLTQQGLQPFPLPMAIDYTADPHRIHCIRCKTCDGYPCKINAKADAQTCCVEPALKYENVTLLEQVKVTRLLTNDTGTSITAVEAIVNDQGTQMPQLFSADIVVVACGAVNSAVLLLQSANTAHPNGLANRSGMVGRNFMRHNLSKLYAIGFEENHSEFQKTLGINDFYRSADRNHADHPNADPQSLPLGHVHLMGKHTWEMMRPDLPRFIPRSVLKLLSQHSVDWWVQSEDLPDYDNRVRLNEQGKICIDYQPNNLKAHQGLKTKFKSILRNIGFPLILDCDVPLKIMNHQVGTCRFGHDPQTSVLDRHCRSHDIDNLYVVDSSFFPSSSAVNPSLTIVANALRVAEHLQQRLGITMTAGMKERNEIVA